MCTKACTKRIGWMRISTYRRRSLSWQAIQYPSPNLCMRVSGTKHRLSRPFCNSKHEVFRFRFRPEQNDLSLCSFFVSVPWMAAIGAREPSRAMDREGCRWMRLSEAVLLRIWEGGERAQRVRACARKWFSFPFSTRTK